MVRYKYNDGGRKAAGYSEEKLDCVVRAFALVSGIDYTTAHKIVKDKCNRKDKHKPKSGGKWLKQLYPTAKVIHLRKPRPRLRTLLQKVHLKNAIVHIRGHVFCVKDNIVLDVVSCLDNCIVDYYCEIESEEKMTVIAKVCYECLQFTQGQCKGKDKIIGKCRRFAPNPEAFDLDEQQAETSPTPTPEREQPAVNTHPNKEKVQAQQKKRENFCRLRDRRLTQLNHVCKLLKNLANKGNYSYTDEDTVEVFKTIDRRKQDLELAFKKK